MRRAPGREPGAALVSVRPSRRLFLLGASTRDPGGAPPPPPPQNRVTELYSQIRFLRIFPFAVSHPLRQATDQPAPGWPHPACGPGAHALCACWPAWVGPRHSHAHTHTCTQTHAHTPALPAPQHHFCSKCDCVTLDHSFTLSSTACDRCGHGPYQHYRSDRQLAGEGAAGGFSAAHSNAPPPQAAPQSLRRACPAPRPPLCCSCCPLTRPRPPCRFEPPPPHTPAVPTAGGTATWPTPSRPTATRARGAPP